MRRMLVDARRSKGVSLKCGKPPCLLALDASCPVPPRLFLRILNTDGRKDDRSAVTSQPYTEQAAFSICLVYTDGICTHLLFLCFSISC